MELNEYQSAAMATRLPSSDNFCYMMFGLVEEVGELAGKVSKGIRKGISSIGLDGEVSAQLEDQDEARANDIYFLDGADEQLAAIKKELGDVMWMVAGLADEFGWSLEDVCRENLRKLADRQKRGVVDGSGDNR
ncbi:MAG: nucleoside triphosphate pyrophosphohydrolase family protein [Bacteroidales bacterium]|nr:nucleoside triphosphate pyrophosphohydrolase family protein [Bacteroidales bacterium]